MQMNKTLYYSILLKWCLNLYFQTVLSHTALINVVVFGLGNKLIMAVLLGEGDSLFPLEPFSGLFPEMHNVKYSENLHFNNALLPFPAAGVCEKNPYAKKGLHIFKNHPCSQWVMGMSAVILNDLAIFQCFRLMVDCGIECGDNCDG